MKTSCLDVAASQVQRRNRGCRGNGWGVLGWRGGNWPAFYREYIKKSFFTVVFCGMGLGNELPTCMKTEGLES